MSGACLHRTSGFAARSGTLDTEQLEVHFAHCAAGVPEGATTDTSGALMVATTRRLAPGEGLTVVAELPSDAVEPPSESQLLWYRLFDNRAWIFGGIGLFVVLGYYFAAWEAVGRNPKGGVVIPLFHPPPGISPALANYVHDWASVATSGAPSRRPPCRWRCAAFCAWTIAADR